MWNGSSCVAPVCNSYISNANAYCPAGQTGYITNQNTYDCNNNLLSTVEIANTCVTPVSCPGPTTQYTIRPVGQTGQMLVTTNYTMTNGTCTSSVTTDSSGCSTTPVSCTLIVLRRLVLVQRGKLERQHGQRPKTAMEQQPMERGIPVRVRLCVRQTLLPQVLALHHKSETPLSRPHIQDLLVLLLRRQILLLAT